MYEFKVMGFRQGKRFHFFGTKKYNSSSYAIIQSNPRKFKQFRTNHFFHRNYFKLQELISSIRELLTEYELLFS